MRSAWTVMPVDDPDRQVLHVVEQDRRVGQDHALGADECEMSRSCQSATFSSPACA